jgi:hypothetical protein
METKRGESKDATCKVMLTINLHNIEQKSLLQKRYRFCRENILDATKTNIKSSGKQIEIEDI